MPTVMSIIWALALALSATPTPSSPLAPSQGIVFTLSESLLDFGLEQDRRFYSSFDIPSPSLPALDRLSGRVPDLFIAPQFVERDPEFGTHAYRFARRLSNLPAGLMSVRWWVYGAWNDRYAWIFAVQPNTRQVTVDELAEFLRNDPSRLILPSHLLFAPELCERARVEDDPPAVYTLEPVPVTFADGQGWATLHFCIHYGWWVGDGFECGACGTDYTAVVWYSFHGVTNNGAQIIHLTVPVVLNDLPQRSAQITTCQVNPEQMTRSFSPPLEEWAVFGWQPASDNDYCYPRLTLAAQHTLTDELIVTLTQRRDSPLEVDDPLALIFAGLNDTFATLRLQMNAIPR